MQFVAPRHEHSWIAGIDRESFLIAPGLAAPPSVCWSWSAAGNALLHVDRAEQLVRALIEHKVLAGANIAFDMAGALVDYGPSIARPIFEAYKQNRIVDVLINQRLEDIANGCLDGRRGRDGKQIKHFYSLAAVTQRRLNKYRAKGEDTWRLRYSELYPERDTTLWPKDAQSYAIEDAEGPRDIYLLQQETGLLRDHGFQAFAAFALYLMTCRGIRTDRESCEKLIEATQDLLERARLRCLRHGLIDAVTKKKSIKAARDRLVKKLGGAAVQAEIKALAAEHKATVAARLEKKIERIGFDYGLSERQLRKAIKRLKRVLSLDESKTSQLKHWQDYGYDPEMYRDLRSTIEVKPRDFSVTLASGRKIKLTKTGMVKIDAETLKSTGDKTLIAYATYGSSNSLLKKAQTMLRGADVPLQTSYISLVETGRTSSRKGSGLLIGDNFQNFRRSAMSVGTKGEDDYEELPGQRECIIARPGFVLCSIDFDAAEMRSFAQLALDHLGYSRIAETLNAGRDPHLALAALSILGISYEEAERRYKAADPIVDKARQYAKIPNFALLGGGGWRILPDYAKGMGIDLDDAKAKELYDAFHEAWTEVKPMHKHYGSFIHKRFEHPVTRRLRYLTRYAQACNNPFQGLTADAAKWACCRLAEEEYCPDGTLYGAYSVLFQHDEVILELPEDRASEYAWEATRIMIEAYNAFTPDVTMTASPALMRRLTKGAKTVLHPTARDSANNRFLLIYGA